MQEDQTSSRRPLSTLAWAALITLIFLAGAAAIVALAPEVLHVVAIVFAMLVGFAICALPFATVLGIVVLITRHRRASAVMRYGYADPSAAGLPAAGPSRGAPQAPRPAPARRPPSPAAGLPPALQALVAGIQEKVGALRDPRQWHLVGPEDQIHVERISDEYLPAILETFRSIPRGTQTWQVSEAGPTAVEVVERQLRLLEQGLDAIAERVFKAGAAQLLAQQQFLEARLGANSESELAIR